MKNSLFWIAIIIFGAIMRVIPHEANIAPIGVICLFSSSYAPKRYALGIPILSMLLSDIFLGFHHVMIWVYSSFFLISLTGLYLRNNISFKNVFVYSLFSSFLFYIVTNFGVWVSTNMYSKDLQGLLECYTLALPFLRNTLIGDILYSGILFGGFNILKKHSFFSGQGGEIVLLVKDSIV